MKKTLWQNLYFAFAVLTFACLLLGGGSRLIAAPEKETAAFLPAEHWLSASLTCPPTVRQYEASEREMQENGQNTVSFVCFERCETDHIDVQTDANGNVLIASSYMRSVYQAFALGDGFA